MFVEMARELYKTGNLSSARIILDISKKTNMTNECKIYAMYIEASIELSKGNREKAEKIVETMLKTFPKEIDSHAYAKYFYKRTDNLNESLRETNYLSKNYRHRYVQSNKAGIKRVLKRY